MEASKTNQKNEKQKHAQPGKAAKKKGGRPVPKRVHYEKKRKVADGTKRNKNENDLVNATGGEREREREWGVIQAEPSDATIAPQKRISVAEPQQLARYGPRKSRSLRQRKRNSPENKNNKTRERKEKIRFLKNTHPTFPRVRDKKKHDVVRCIYQLLAFSGGPQQRILR